MFALIGLIRRNLTEDHGEGKGGKRVREREGGKS